MKRTQKIHLLTALVTGTATSKQLADLRQSQEPIYLTLNLGTDNNPMEQDPNEPTYHIDIYSDGTVNCYDLYPDGQIEYRI
ncbi:hypothetical protein [Spirosoma fluviale]|uniref:Uncharacterized protein n=1 Tax=Spirosoma fluviale TaxID=1597977 RepID=A0A286GWB2_9BACT|nr:hypothetical protein [Spirosoma fluviale]SOD99791.1 hypothetical protein SAMN06269250_0168 [Spirosoma fluviale]